VDQSYHQQKHSSHTLHSLITVSVVHRGRRVGLLQRWVHCGTTQVAASDSAEAWEAASIEGTPLLAAETPGLGGESVVLLMLWCGDADGISGHPYEEGSTEQAVPPASGILPAMACWHSDRVGELGCGAEEGEDQTLYQV
jgi:hypothetical protein